MDEQICTLKCSDGDEVCCLANLEKFSVAVHQLLSEACRCTATVILPDLKVGEVTLAMSLLVGSVGEEGLVLESDLLDKVLPVFDLLRIPCSLPTPETNNNVLDPETGALQVCKLLF